MSILLGNGDGTFQVPLDLEAGYFPGAIAAADFNGDGFADIAVSNQSGDNVSFAFGNGDGTFQPLVVYGGVVSPRTIVVADFNGDGYLDLAAIGAGIQVLLANPDGTFQVLPSTNAGATLGAAVIEDFDGDHIPDIVLNQSDGSLSLILGKGDGSFQPPATIPGANAVFLAVADFNGDGRADLAALSSLFVSNISLLLNQAPFGSTPSIRTANGVVNSANLQPGVSPGTWITILGDRLSTSTRSWAQSDFNGNLLPRSLDGVKVTFNGEPGYVSYVSPGQINVLAPKDLPSGTVSVQVTNSAGSSNVVSTTSLPLAPAFFAYSQQSGKYAIAEDGGTLSFLGPSGLFGGSVQSKPATAGEVIVLYATGLGDANPGYSDGQIVSAAIPLPSLPQVTIGGAPASVQYAGLIGPGLYQINVVVPQVPSGDAPILLGAPSSAAAGVYLSIR